MKNSFVIAFDFDSVLNNMFPYWIAWLNTKHSLNIDWQTVSNWQMTEVFPMLTEQDIFEPLDRLDFWSNVEAMPGMPELVNRLKVEGHTVIVITSSHYKELYRKIEDCLFRLFPSIAYKDVIVTSKKYLVKCDFLIDDYEENLKNSEAIRILWDMPYNRLCSKDTYDFRVYSTDDIYAIINAERRRLSQ